MPAVAEEAVGGAPSTLDTAGSSARWPVTASTIRVERIIRVRGGEYDSSIIEAVVILVIIVAAIRFFVKRA